MDLVMMYGRAWKGEPLLRLNPLNLPKIGYFVKWVKGVKFVPSFLLFWRVLMVQTHIFLKIKDHCILLGDCKPWDKPFRPEKTVKVDKIRYVASSNPHAVQKKLPQKILREENFSNLVSYLCYTYYKTVHEKIWEKPILWPRIDMRILQRLALKSQHHLLTNFPIKLHKIN